jgi:hypothetical protein
MRRRFAAPLALLLTLALAVPAAAANFPATIPLPPDFAPEGITAGRGTTVFVGSLATGEIWKGDVRTGQGDVFTEPAGAQAVGVEYERGADRLWVAGGMSGEVRVYDATSGEQLAEYAFGPGGFLNDLVVTRDAVYVTDSFRDRLDVIPLGTGGALPAPSEVELLPLSGDFELQPGFNLNGIVARNGWLIAVQTGTASLFRIDPATGDSDLIDIGAASVSFGDGLELRGDRLYVIRNQIATVSVFELAGDLLSAEHLGDIGQADTPSTLDVTTTGAFQAGRLWVVNARFGTTDEPPVEYWLSRLPTQP